MKIDTNNITYRKFVKRDLERVETQKHEKRILDKFSEQNCACNRYTTCKECRDAYKEMMERIKELEALIK